MNSAFDTYFTALKNKKIAVLGLGVSNRPLVRLLLEYGCHVTGCDRTPREKVDAEVLELETLGCTLRLGDNYLEGVEAGIAQGLEVGITQGLEAGIAQGLEQGEQQSKREMILNMFVNVFQKLEHFIY